MIRLKNILPNGIALFLVIAVSHSPAAQSQEQSLNPGIAPGPVRSVISLEEMPAKRKTLVPQKASFSFLENSSPLQMSVDGSETLVSEDGYFTGIRSGAVLTGTVRVQINPDAGLRIKKAAYYLNGTQSGKEYASPFTWGGPGGFDTTQLSEGTYRLSGYITTTRGDLHFSYTFQVDHSGQTEPEPNPQPQPLQIPPAGRTAGGLDFSGLNASFVDTAHAGTLSYLADGKNLYVVNARDPFVPRLVSTVSFETPILDIEAEDGAVYVLESPFKKSENTSAARLWKIDTSNPAAPRRLAFEAESLALNPKKIRLFNDSVIVLHSHEYGLLDCPKDAAAPCSLPYNSYFFGDFVQKNSWGTFFASTGSLTLGASNPRHGHEGFGIPLSAPLGHMTGRGELIFASLQNGTVEIFDTTQIPFDAFSAGVSPVAVIPLSQTNPINSIAKNGVLAVLNKTGLVEIFDVTNPLSTRRIDSVTITGARSIGLDSDYLYAVTQDEYRIVHRINDTGPEPKPEPKPQPEPGIELVSEDGYFTGVRSGAVLSGTVKVRINPEAGLHIKKVAYYLNAAKAGKEYAPPFTWGGPGGFDTTLLKDGSYTLAGYITTTSGDRIFAYNFEVQNKS